jgi:hypothetical protein
VLDAALGPDDQHRRHALVTRLLASLDAPPG